MINVTSHENYYFGFVKITIRYYKHYLKKLNYQRDNTGNEIQAIKRKWIYNGVPGLYYEVRIRITFTCGLRTLKGRGGVNWRSSRISLGFSATKMLGEVGTPFAGIVGLPQPSKFDSFSLFKTSRHKTRFKLRMKSSKQKNSLAVIQLTIIFCERNMGNNGPPWLVIVSIRMLILLDVSTIMRRISAIRRSGRLTHAI